MARKLFEPGKSGNPNGRKKGISNKVTTELRETITGFIKKNITNIQKKFDKLEEKDQLFYFEKLLRYCLPTLQAIDTTPQLTPEQIEEIYERLKNDLRNEL